MEKDTKERILIEALNLFSQKGYAGVSVQEIAQAVGIKAPSLYKHYSGKEAIFQAILDEGTKRYQMAVGQWGLDGLSPTEDSSKYQGIDGQSLREMTLSVFRFFLHDEFQAALRRILVMGQYGDEALANRFVHQYVYLPMSFQTSLFQQLRGTLDEKEAKGLALNFYAPIFTLLMLCDAKLDYEEEAMELLGRHLDSFGEIHGLNDKEAGEKKA